MPTTIASGQAEEFMSGVPGRSRRMALQAASEQKKALASATNPWNKTANLLTKSLGFEKGQLDNLKIISQRTALENRLFPLPVLKRREDQRWKQDLDLYKKQIDTYKTQKLWAKDQKLWNTEMLLTSRKQQTFLEKLAGHFSTGSKGPGLLGSSFKFLFKGLEFGLGMLIKSLLTGSAFRAAGNTAIGAGRGLLGLVSFFGRGGPLGIMFKAVGLLGTAFLASKFGTYFTKDNINKVIGAAVTGLNNVYDFLVNFAKNFSFSDSIKKIQDFAKDQFDNLTQKGIKQYVVDVFDTTMSFFGTTLTAFSTYVSGSDFTNSIKNYLTKDNLTKIMDSSIQAGRDAVQASLVAFSSAINSNPMGNVSAASLSQDVAKFVLNVSKDILVGGLTLLGTGIKSLFLTGGSALLSAAGYMSSTLVLTAPLVMSVGDALYGIGNAFGALNNFFKGKAFAILKDIRNWAPDLESASASFKEVGDINVAIKGILNMGFVTRQTLWFWKTLSSAVEPLVGAFRLIGGAAKLVGKLAWPIQAIVSIFDFVTGWENAASNLGIAPDKLNFGDKIASGLGAVIAGLLSLPNDFAHFLERTIFGKQIDATTTEDITKASAEFFKMAFDGVRRTIVEPFDYITQFVKDAVSGIADLFSVDNLKKKLTTIVQSIPGASYLFGDDASSTAPPAPTLPPTMLPPIIVNPEFGSQQLGMTPGSSGFAGRPFSPLPRNAHGNAFPGSVVPFALGGVVNTPTPFRISDQKTGVFGEAGPEGIFPLGRTKQGDLGVKVTDMLEFKKKSITIDDAAIIVKNGVQQAGTAVANIAGNAGASVSTMLGNAGSAASSMTGRATAAIADNSTVQSAIEEAAKISGVSTNTLYRMSGAESGLKPNVRNGDGGAAGLFQFMPNTWTEMVRRYGSKYNIGQDDVMNPRANAIMGGLYTRDNTSTLRNATGHDPNDTDLYMGHFLGLGGATRFFDEMKRNPNQSAASLFAGPAKQNRNIFYTSDGKPRSLQEIYQTMGQHLEQGDKIASSMFGTATNAVGAAATSTYNAAKPAVESAAGYVGNAARSVMDTTRNFFGGDHALQTAASGALRGAGFSSEAVSRIMEITNDISKYDTPASLASAYQGGRKGSNNTSMATSQTSIPAGTRGQHAPPSQAPIIVQAPTAPAAPPLNNPPNMNSDAGNGGSGATPNIDSIPFAIDEMGMMLINSHVLS